jgi:hypothetical protein
MNFATIIRNFILPLRRFIASYLVPFTDHAEFKALYTLLVVFLGVLAASRTDSLRAAILLTMFLLIASVAVFTIYFDYRRISLDLNWNILFFSYYRPFLIQLTNRISRSLDGKQKVDILTYRTGDFIAELEKASADFEQVSGNPIVNIASFDIEYVPVLRQGVRVGRTLYKLIPLSNFWSGSEVFEFPNRIPKVIRLPTLQRLDGEHLYALPIGWGLVGVSVIETDLSGSQMITSLTVESHGRRGVDFHHMFKNLDLIAKNGYQILCYDLWNSIGQLVSLNCTGHMTISPGEEASILEVFNIVNDSLPPANIISDPGVLLSRAKTTEKVIVIGGSTWFGMKGTLLPIAIPQSRPAYGAFCECLGVLASPSADSDDGVDWGADASRLVGWLATTLGDQRYAPPITSGTGSILRNYLPGLLGPPHSHQRGRPEDVAEVDLWDDQPMQIDKSADIIFRQLPATSLAASTRLKDLWTTSRQR